MLVFLSLSYPIQLLISIFDPTLPTNFAYPVVHLGIRDLTPINWAIKATFGRIATTSTADVTT